jgi:hypothetical protein
VVARTAPVYRLGEINAGRALPMSPRLEVVRSHAIDFWLARGAVVVIVAMQLAVSSRLTLGPRWLAPAMELALLAPLSIATAWTYNRVQGATTDHHWSRIYRLRRSVRWLAVILTGLVSAANLGSLFLLVQAMMTGHAGTGPTLLIDAVNIWSTNIIAFALWFWNIDRGGPATRGLVANERPDFLFSNMLPGPTSRPDWSPGFVDYLYLSFTNATALSPADTLPLSQRAKMLMMMEACVSLVTIAVVAGRAVNILQ